MADHLLGRDPTQAGQLGILGLGQAAADLGIHLGFDAGGQGQGSPLVELLQDLGNLIWGFARPPHGFGKARAQGTVVIHMGEISHRLEGQKATGLQGLLWGELPLGHRPKQILQRCRGRGVHGG